VNGRREAGGPRPASRVAGFRTRLLLAMTAVIFAAAAGVLYLAERRLAANAAQAFELEFRSALAALHDADRIRQTVMAGRGRELARRPRIHAALEDDAPDLLYPSAQDELADLMTPDPANPALLGVRFCRFLGRSGAPIPPAPADAVGRLEPAEEEALRLRALPARQEIGYLPRAGGGVTEIILTPIISGDTGEVIAALVLGFDPVPLPLADGRGIRTGIWLGRGLHLFPGGLAVGDALAPAVNAALAGPAPPPEASFPLSLAGEPRLIFCKCLNPGSAFPPAYEICVYSLAELAARQRHLRWEMLGAAAVVLLGAFGAGEILSLRFSSPVEKLAVESERSARFSADASHQLKTPVTVLRAGLEELLAGEHLTPEQCAQLSALVHQTYRLSSLIDDLLLLARMDAGRLKLERAPVALRDLLDACTDDFSAMPDPHMPEIESRLAGRLEVSGEKRYLAIILHNLLENSRKYNRPGGRIRIEAREDERRVHVRIGNTGPGIPPEAQAQLFERFRRGRQGEAVPGYGLGLNLARELARLHGGDLRLVASSGDWTEFELTLERAEAPPA
jgi:signal transduction histidine kinase